MASRQKARSEETKLAILTAAGKLFAERGYDTVTMREIASAAGCSHTAIYIYFKDKEALLQQLSTGPLQSLQARFESALANPALSPEERLRLLTREFIRFCLMHRNLYRVFFMANATRVDEKEPAFELNRLRNHLFALLGRAVKEYLDLSTEEQMLAFARVHFFTVHGIITTYADSPEPFDKLMERLDSTFDLAVDVLLSGSKQSVKGVGTK